MKTLFAFILISFSLASCAQSNAIDKFYDAHSNEEGSLSLNINGTMLHVGSWAIKDEKAKNLVRNSRSARLYVTDSDDNVSLREINKLVRSIRSDGYESLVQARDGNDNFEVFLREKDDFIRNILLIVHGDENLVMASLDCKLRSSEVEDLLEDTL